MQLTLYLDLDGDGVPKPAREAGPTQARVSANLQGEPALQPLLDPSHLGGLHCLFRTRISA
jgi:hypothetical protein